MNNPAPVGAPPIAPTNDMPSAPVQAQTAEPAKAEKAKVDYKSKFMEYLVYEKIHIVDGVLLVIHFIVWMILKF